jgi:hypothetical protein
VYGGNRSIHYTISDASHAGEEKYISIRFFTGMLDGQRTTLLLRADLMNGSGTAHITVFAFHSVEFTQGSFDFVAERYIRRKYCDADAALWKEFSVPLPRRGKPIECQS